MTSDEFRRRMAELPEPVTDKQPPYWEFWRHQLWRLAQTDDPNNFTNWPCVYHTMLVEHWQDVTYYEQISIPLEFYESVFEGITFSTSEYNNLIHQAYHLWTWQQTTGKQIKDLNTIVEFGGGYGAMCLLCHRLGFKGRYVIYDLPEFSLLQEWYLGRFEVAAEWPKGGEVAPEDVDLYIALYSLSEVDLQTRLYFTIPARSYLFLYSGQWEQYDNVKWFQGDWQKQAKGLHINLKNWKHTELTHLPDRNNWYSIGW